MDGKATLRLRSPKKDNIQNLHHENYDVSFYEYSFHKDVNTKGEVEIEVQGGKIIVALPILPTDNLMKWVLDSSLKYNGEITINDGYTESLDRISFEDARPVKFRFHYEPGEETHLMVLLTINARRIVTGGSEFNRE